MMKAVVAFFLLGSVSLAASAATPERVQFTGAVLQERGAPVALDLQLPSGQAASLRLPDGATLELATPGSPASPDGARIRLLSPAGAVLHTAVVPDTGLASTSFAYRVCAGEVTYMSPAPDVVPACGQ
jgi:hypothetical protein